MDFVKFFDALNKNTSISEISICRSCIFTQIILKKANKYKNILSGDGFESLCNLLNDTVHLTSLNLNGTIHFNTNKCKGLNENIDIVEMNKFNNILIKKNQIIKFCFGIIFLLLTKIAGPQMYSEELKIPKKTMLNFVKMLGENQFLQIVDISIFMIFY